MIFFFFVGVSRSGLILVPRQSKLFPAANQIQRIRKSKSRQTDELPSCPPLRQGWRHILGSFPTALMIKANSDVSSATCLSVQPANHSADSFSVWQEVVVVALPSLLSFRKLGFSTTTATAASLLLVFSSLVKARFSEALADSPSLGNTRKIANVRAEFEA